jgi:L-malate glycosyltransferase
MDSANPLLSRPVTSISQHKMRILIVISEDQECGGVSSVVDNLARYLQLRGHEVIFLNSGKTTFLKTKRTKRGFTGFELNLQMPFGTRHPFISIALFLIRFPIALYQLIRLIRKHKIQIVNIHYPAECFVYFALCRRILPIGLITSVHGAELFPDGRPSAEYSRSIKLLLNGSDRVIAPSRSFQQDVSNLFPLLKKKTIAIHNSIDLAQFNGISPHTSKDHQDPYILCIAMHNEKKALDVLIRAFALIQDKERSLKLVLVGDGPLRSQLEDLAVSLKIWDKVEFLGFQGPAQVRNLLHGCELFVLPSRSEPFGIAIIEAMACKKAVIATDVGGIPEIIESGKNGVLVKPNNPCALADAIVTLLCDKALRLKISSQGYVTVRQQFRSEKTGSAYESVFSNIVRSEPKGSLTN